MAAAGPVALPDCCTYSTLNVAVAVLVMTPETPVKVMV